nr:PIN-like domain-containing protein [Streptomyces rubrogriseus]
MLTKGSVVLDTNVLLGLYRMDNEARGEFFSVLDALRSRIWVPRQVATEFHANRISALDVYLKSRKEKGDAVKSSIDDLRKSLRSFANIRSLIGERKEAYLRPLEEFLDALSSDTDASLASFDLTVQALVGDDPVLVRLSKLLDGRVGDGIPQERREEELKEAKRRGVERIPPGYKDMEDKGEGGYGDYFIWSETLEYATVSKNPILFVSNDTKEDWMNRQCGLTIGPRPELVAEMRRVANVDYHQISSAALLVRANEALKINVSQRTIDQAEGQQNSDQRRLNRRVMRPQLHDHYKSVEASWNEAQRSMYQLREVVVDRARRIDDLDAELRHGAKGSSELSATTLAEKAREHAVLTQQNIEDLKRELEFQKLVAHLQDELDSARTELVAFESEMRPKSNISLGETAAG